MAGEVFPLNYRDHVLQVIKIGIIIGDDKTMSNKRASVLSEAVLAELGKHGYTVSKITEPDNHHNAAMCPYCRGAREVVI